MVVDNSIVALENIDSWRRRGKSPAQAAYHGVREIWGALLASTVTTAAVFLPIIGWQDEVGELLRDVAVAIALAVGVSLVVSVLVIPSFSARLLRATAEPEGEGRGLGAGLRRSIGRQVALLTGSWRRGLLVAVAAVAGAVALAQSLLPAMEYLPTGNRNLIFGILLPPPGYSPDELDVIGRDVQAQMVAHTGVEKDGLPAIERSFFVGSPNQVIFGLIAQDEERIGELVPFVRQAGGRAPGAFAFASQASLFGREIGGGRAVEVELSGADLTAVIGLGGRLMGAIGQAIPGAQIRPIPSLDLGAPELHAVPRRDETAGLAVGGAELGLVVDTYVDGAIVGELGPAGEPKIDVALRALRPGGREVDDPESLAASPVATPSGDIVPLSSLARLEEHLGPTLIRRIERRRSITLQVSPPESVPLEDAMATIRDDVLAPLQEQGQIPAGIQTELSGTAGKLEGAKERLGEVLLLAVIISFLLLAALFEDFLAPIAVLVTVPLAGGGGVLGMWLVDRYLAPQPFDLMTALGFVILIGVVVNNAILVVDGALARLREGLSLHQAVPAAVEARVRPIFMSTATSVAGLLPSGGLPRLGRRALSRRRGDRARGARAVDGAHALRGAQLVRGAVARARGSVAFRRGAATIHHRPLPGYDDLGAGRSSSSASSSSSATSRSLGRPTKRLTSMSCGRLITFTVRPATMISTVSSAPCSPSGSTRRRTSRRPSDVRIRNKRNRRSRSGGSSSRLRSGRLACTGL